MVLNLRNLALRRSAANSGNRLVSRSLLLDIGIKLPRLGKQTWPTPSSPPKKMAANAKKGLTLRQEFNRGGTDVGVHRAEQLAEQKALSAEDVKSIHSYFARHEIDKKGKSLEWGSDENPSAGYIAWLLWGGDEERNLFEQVE